MRRFFWSPVISASLSPNTEFDDVARAWWTIVRPWLWNVGGFQGKIEQWFRQYTGSPCAVSFNSGRSAQLAILKAFSIGKGDEVIVQAFTCVAVPNSVSWAGAMPIYADIDPTYNMDPRDIEKKITPKTRAIIVQHTFGISANLQKIRDIAVKHKLILIEDCAHALGGEYEGKKLGTFGDAAFFSFGRDKILSSVFGGLATIRADHVKEIASLKAYHKKLDYPAWRWIFQQIVHPIIFSVVVPWYRVGFGKMVLVACQRLHLLSFPVYPQEKHGIQPGDFPAKYPNALAFLLWGQLKKLERYNAQRVATAQTYQNILSVKTGLIVPSYRQGDIYLRFPVLVEDPKKCIANAKQHGILLGNWYQHIIDPTGTEFAAVGYTMGSCPRAEHTASHVVNLPTRISLKDAACIMNLF